MHKKRFAAFAATAVTPLLLPLITVGTAHAHGSMDDPISRVYQCYQEGPESPQSDACKAAVATSGPQAFYDWNAVRIADVAGEHRAEIPDGELCSAGNEKYAGLDLARDDWDATPLEGGSDVTFHYRATAEHEGGFELYITNDEYDPTEPLAWSDLESEPFLTVDDPAVEDGSYVLDGTLPDGKDGRHLIYAIWQRTDSPEAFYSCSDVVFGAEGTTEGGAGDDSTGSGDSEHGQNASDETAGDATDSAANSDSDNTTADPTTAVADSDGDSGPGAAAAGENVPRASGSNQPQAESATAADTATEDLAYTGVDSSTILIIGGALVIAGTGAVLTVRGHRSRGRRRFTA